MHQYQKIMAELTEDIRAGNLPEGHKLPSERELCERFQVSSKTVKYALRELEHIGIVTRRNGVGTFVSQPVTGGGEVHFCIPGLFFQGYYHEMLSACEKKAREENRTMLYHATGNEYKATRNWVLRSEPDPSAILVFSPLTGEHEHKNSELLSLLKKKFRKIILLDNRVPEVSGCWFVGNENIGSSFALTEILINRKYDRYLFVSGGESGVIEMRKDGFSQAVRSYGIPEERVLYRDSPRDALREIRNFTAEGETCGVFCVNDGNALSVYTSLLEEGIQVPEQAGVTGFGDIHSLPIGNITTAKIDFTAIADAIFSVSGSETPEAIVIPSPVLRRRTA